MKKLTALVLSLAVLIPFRQASAVASQNDGKHKSTLKILTKFSIPIVATAALGGIGGYSYYRYKNKILTLSGEITKEKTDELFQTIEELKNQGRNCIVIFKDATIKAEAFKFRKFDCEVKFQGDCKIESGSCEYTYFSKKFEIGGSILSGSSLKGAIFKYCDLIINGNIPENLLHGALVLIKTQGVKYKLPGNPKLIYDKKNLNETKEYLEKFVK